MPGTQADAADMVATAMALPHLPPYVMEALGVAGNLITEQQASLAACRRNARTATKLLNDQQATIETLTETMMNIRDQRDVYADKCEKHEAAIERLTKRLKLTTQEPMDFALLIEAKNDTIERLERAFRHTHEAKRVDGVLVDECGKCGLDIREDVHERAALAESEGDGGSHE